MDCYFSMKTKRKELEDVNDDFSDFSLSSPARKIRRLDAELPPIVEEEDCDSVPRAFELPTAYNHSSASGVTIEELPENEERSIVLFKPVNSNTLARSRSDFSLSVAPELIEEFKNKGFWSNKSNSLRLVSDEDKKDDAKSDSSNGCMAVVPWIPSQVPSAPEVDISSELDTEVADMMDADEIEAMDVEDNSTIEQRNFQNVGGVSISQGLQQWQQQHCVFPQPPQNVGTPIVWYR